MKRLRAAVVGCGFMGGNHARVLADFADIELVGVVDTDLESAGACAVATGSSSFESVDAVGELDLAVVTVPTAAHVEVANALVSRGVHVLVEKPFAATVDSAVALTNAARARGLVLAVGHIERFNPALAALREMVTDPRLLSFERLSPFTPRIGDDVVMDLMIHDIDIALWILGGYPKRVQASGASVFSDTIDVASAVLEFDGGRVVTLQASRATQDKVRRVSVSEPERFIVADSVGQSISVKRHTTAEFLTDGGAPLYKQSSVVETPYLDRTGEPLLRELRDFVDAVRDTREPLVTGEDGIRALRLAEQIREQIGAPEGRHA